METVIYVDVLVVLNFIITYLLLLCTASALRLSPSAVRLFFGSLLGGVSSLMIFLPPLPLPLTLVCKAAICALITLTALPAGSLRLFLRNGAFFLLTNVLFAGIIFALMCIFSPGGVQMNNGAVYLELNFFSLLGTAVLSFVLVSVYNHYLRRQKMREEIVQMTVFVGGRQFTCRALYDSGNRLTDGYFGAPVAVVHFDVVKEFLPYELLPFFSGEIYDIYACSREWSGRIRFLPTETVGGEGLLPCFRSDAIEIHTKSHTYITRRALVAVTVKGFQNTDYSALVGPDMFSDEIKGEKNEGSANHASAEKMADVSGHIGKRAERAEKPV